MCTGVVASTLRACPECVELCIGGPQTHTHTETHTRTQTHTHTHITRARAPQVFLHAARYRASGSRVPNTWVVGFRYRCLVFGFCCFCVVQWGYVYIYIFIFIGSPCNMCEGFLRPDAE